MIRHLDQALRAARCIKTTAFCQIFMPQISNIDFTVAWQPQMEVSCGMHPVKCKYYRCLDNIHNNYMHITMPTKIWVWLVHCSARSPWFLTLDEDDKHKKNSIITTSMPMSITLHIQVNIHGPPYQLSLHSSWFSTVISTYCHIASQVSYHWLTL